MEPRHNAIIGAFFSHYGCNVVEPFASQSCETKTRSKNALRRKLVFLSYKCARSVRVNPRACDNPANDVKLGKRYLLVPASSAIARWRDGKGGGRCINLLNVALTKALYWRWPINQSKIWIFCSLNSVVFLWWVCKDPIVKCEWFICSIIPKWEEFRFCVTSRTIRDWKEVD